MMISQAILLGPVEMTLTNTSRQVFHHTRMRRYESRGFCHHTRMASPEAWPARAQTGRIVHNHRGAFLTRIP